MVIKNSILALFTLLLLSGLQAQAAQILVEADRDPIESDESFTLTFTATEAVDGQPDFRPLENDFKIISRNQSSNIQIINGRMSRQTQWTLYLMPKKSGKLTIPVISFGDDKSSKMQVTVNKVKHSADDKKSGILFLETEVDNQTAYVQSQIIYTIRIYQAVNLLNASLSELSLSDSNAVVEKIGEDKTFEKRVDGRRFKVFEKRYAIFPQKSGTLMIQATELEAQYVDNRRALRTKLLRSDSIDIKVKPKPLVQTVQNNPWLPAKHMQIKEEWPQDPPVLRVGEPVTRTITLVAEGLSSAQLPEIAMGEVKNMKQYLDQPTTEDKKSASGVIGMRQEKIALIPTQTGRYTIPAIEIPWWNTQEDRLEYLRIPKREVKVQPGSGTAQQTPAQAVSGAQTQELSPAEEKPQSDISAREKDQSIGSTESGREDVFVWMVVSLVAFIGWIVTGLAWWRNRARHHQTMPTYLLPAPSGSNPAVNKQQLAMSLKQSAKALKAACIHDNAHEAKNALLLWGRSLWPNKSPGNLLELSRVCGGDLGDEVLKLNQFLYSKEKLQWEADDLWQTFSRYKKPDYDGSESDSNSHLEPLYRTTVS